MRPFGGSPKIGKAGVEVNLAQRANRGYILIRVIFNEKEANKLFELKEGDVISFVGRLADMSMSMLTDYHFRLENGEVSKITKKDTKYYGELSIENLIIMPHIFGDEMCIFYHGLRRCGERYEKSCYYYAIKEQRQLLDFSLSYAGIYN
ncbi:MAG: hypothetical protein ACOYU0_08640 [Nitrospirota bacterium]